MLHSFQRKTSVLAIITAISVPALATTELPAVIVTANHTQQALHTATANVTVITAQDIESNHYRSVDDVLHSVAGVQIVRNGGMGTNTSVIMRGQSNKNTLVLVNGVEMTNPMGTGGAIMGHLLLSDIERIEVLKGPQSGIWGANASAGVINIITKQAKAGSQGQISVETGSFNHQKLATSFSAGNEQGDMSIQFSNLTRDGFSAVKGYKQDQKNYEDDAFNQTDFALNIGINLNQQHRIETLVKTADSTAEFDGTDNPDQASSNQYQNEMTQLQYLYQHDQFESTVFASQNRIKQYSDAIINRFGIKGGVDYAANQTFGFTVINNQYQNLADATNYTNTAIGLSNTNAFNNETLFITESIRADLFNQFDDKTTGKLGIKNYFTPNFFMAANVGTAYTAPTLFQLTYGATNDLQPEETQGYDFTVGYAGFEATYYQSETKNLMQYSGTWPNDYYENLTGISRFSGIEASYNRYVKSINTMTTLSFHSGSAKDSNKEWLARRAEQTLSLNLLYDGFNRVNLGLNSRYIGKMYDKANQLGAQIGEYVVMDANINYHANKNVTFYLNALNITNHDYTNAVAKYEGDNVTPMYVYSNGGTQLFVGVQGKF